MNDLEQGQNNTPKGGNAEHRWVCSFEEKWGSINKPLEKLVAQFSSSLLEYHNGIRRVETWDSISVRRRLLVRFRESVTMTQTEN